ncbi:MAG: hypothetical protein JNL19_02665 [Burkholderiales bacterium]|nr:hypothetical protein [Burkholderiales bacterium]
MQISSRSSRWRPRRFAVAWLIGLSVCASTPGTAVDAAATLKEGVWHIDWNRKVRDLCVDTYSNDDLTARDWQGVMAAQGIICRLSDVQAAATPTGWASSWLGRCSQPGVGRVLDVTYRVSLRIAKSREQFDFLTVISGDQQATIPLRGERRSGADGKCPQGMPFFRPWQ